MKNQKINTGKRKLISTLSRKYFDQGTLKCVDLSMYDTSKVTAMVEVFDGCESLEYINLSSLDTSNVKSMAFMFDFCTSLKSLDLSSFDTSKLRDMEFMFYNNSALTSLNLSSFDTSNVTCMSSVFSGVGAETEGGCEIICPQGLDMSSVTSVSFMFLHAKFAKPIHLKNVPRKLVASGSSPSDWVLCDVNKGVTGERGVHYIIDSVK